MNEETEFCGRVSPDPDAEEGLCARHAGERFGKTAMQIYGFVYSGRLHSFPNYGERRCGKNVRKVIPLGELLMAAQNGWK